MKKLLAALLLTIGATAISAQDAQPTAFIRAMALIPFAEPAANSTIFLSYADYHAGITARGLAIPEDWASWQASDNFSYVQMALPMAGPAGFLQGVTVSGAEYRALLGFDFFDIAQGVEIGTYPAIGQILIGDIDPQAVESAYTARHYSVEAISGLGVLLCPDTGCDSGMTVNLANHNPANPFGGQIGRSEPAAAADGIFLNAIMFEVLQTMMDAVKGDTITFADLPEVQALDHALSAYPFVNAVTLANPIFLANADIMSMLVAQPTPEIDEAIPAYSMAAFASAADEAGQYGFVILTYDDFAEAETAAAIIDDRLGSMNSLLRRTPYREVYESAGQIESAQVVLDETSGVSLVTLRLVGEVPPLEDQDGMVVMSNLPYAWLMDSLLSRDLLWLAWG
ncbi:MAG: hypothetical protein IAE89_02030 [Anaerolineae bacterium]|nr:hypothetical protein [Anaerolineae bacterium]